MNNLTKEDYYSKAFASHGGVYENLEGSPHEYIYWCFYTYCTGRGLFLERILEQKLPPIYLGFSENPGLYAFTTISDDHNFIGIGKETPLILKFVFELMFSHPGFLTGIGDESLETPPKKIPFVKFQSLSQITTVFPFDTWPSPKDDARFEEAMWMVNLSGAFLFLHEMGHLLNGHTAYLKENKIKFQDLDDFTAQTFELDADKFAGHMFFKQVVELAEKGHEFIENETHRKAAERQYVAFAYGAIYVIFRLFSNGEIEVEDAISTKHPVPALRETSLRDAMYTAFSHRDDTVELAFLAQDVRQHIETFFIRLSSEDLGIGALLTVHEFDEHYLSLVNNLKDIRERLSKFSIIPGGIYDRFDPKIRPIKFAHRDLYADLEFETDENGERKVKVILSKYLEQREKLRNIKQLPDDLCICGSGKMYQHCHGAGIAS